MNDYMEMVPRPANSDINTDLSPCHIVTMLRLFGAPGALTQDCSPVTNKRLAAQIVTHKFNNFSVTGWEPAVNDLIAIMTEIYNVDKDLHALIGSAGMLCVRHVRGYSHNFSNHSFGCAWDCTTGGVLTPQRANEIPKALLLMYSHFHRRGWFWGSEFQNADPMHWEPSDQRLRQLWKEKNGNERWG